MTTILAAHALDFGYPHHPVGFDVSLSWQSGELIALLGPNGGGKTTLFRTLLGLIAPQGGQVLLDGEPVARLSRAAFAQRVAYVPQSHAGYFPFLALDMVTMGRTAHLSPFATPSRQDRARAREAMERVNVARLADAPYTRLSGGERQLVLIARALAQGSPLIVMDEPTASLDFGNQSLVLAEIARLKAAGAGILLSTHDPDHALQLADRVALLHQGRLLDIGPPASTVTPSRLATLYGVDVAIHEVTGPDGVMHRIALPATTAREPSPRPLIR